MLPADCEHLGVTERGQQERKPVRIGHGVVVEERQDSPSCGADPGVARPADPASGFSDNPYAVALSNLLYRCGVGTIVDHDDLARPNWNE